MIKKHDLYTWCSIKAEELPNHPQLKIPFRVVGSSSEMGELMVREIVGEIKHSAREERKLRIIIPCGPSAWYEPYVRLVNKERISLKHVTVFHMDECLDWQGRLLARNDPYNFRTCMEKNFYDPIDRALSVPIENRVFLNPANMEEVRKRIWEAPIDVTFGGWGQDGHIAYNQSRRHPFSHVTLDDLRDSSIRIQDNNIDTIITLAHRTYGAAYQFVPPMSITLGLKECLSAKKVRLFSDTGPWKQTALRVALFSEPDVEYPMTLLQEHFDALITATLDTATHPISLNPDWEFAGINK